MAEEESAEVRLRLVADDGTGETTSRMQAGLKEMADQVERVNAAFRQMGTAGAGGAAHAGDEMHKAKGHGEDMAGAVFKGGLQLELMMKSAELLKDVVVEGVESMKELGEMALEAAAAEEQQVKAMSGVLSMIDAGAHSYGEVKAYATDLNEELRRSAREAGVSGEAMSDAFMMVQERSNAGSEQVKELTMDMAVVGKVTRGGMEGLSQGFTMMEMGMIRAKNPIVQLIASTHLLHGNARAVAAQMMKMTPAEQMELGEKAIRKMAEQMKKGGAAAPTLGELRTSLAGEKDLFLESMGKPMLEKLLPPLRELKQFLLDNEEAITSFAGKIGTTFGDLIEVVSGLIHAVYSGLAENWDGVKEVAHFAFGAVMGAWDYIYKNKDAIAHTFKDITADVVRAMQFVIHAIQSAAEKAKEILKMVPGVGGMIREHEASRAEEKLHAAARAPDMRAFEDNARAYRNQALAAGRSAIEVDNLIDTMRDWEMQTQRGAGALERSGDDGNLKAFAEAFNKAGEQHNEAMEQFAVDVFAKSKGLQAALMQSTDAMGEGFKDFMAMLQEKSPELAKQLRDAANPIKAQGGIKPQGPVVNFNGGQTFHIKQDFKNEDPDRVAFVFRRDVVKQAEARRQSRVGTPFGL